MKNINFKISILLFTILILGCKQKTVLKKSDFKVSRDYSKFYTKMENNDTLNIGVVLSMCMWREYDKLQLTKSNDSIYIELEKQVMNDKPIHFRKVLYQFRNNTLNLEKMMRGFDINGQKEHSYPFFVIINPKEKDTILLKTTGLVNHGFNIERYQRLISELYPKEMTKYKKDN